MIIDIHYHLMPQVNESAAMRLAKHALKAANIMGKDFNLETIKKKAFETWADPTGEKLIASMEESGIDLTVICIVDNAGVKEATVELIQNANKLAGEISKKYPDKVIALAGVDPRRPQATDMMKQCFQEFGVRGLKYHPDYGYDPSGPDSYRILEVLAENKGILLTHTGPLPPPSRCKFSDPMLLADIGLASVLVILAVFLLWRLYDLFLKNGRWAEELKYETRVTTEAEIAEGKRKLDELTATLEEVSK